MRLLKSVLGRIWAIWALSTFTTSFFIILLPSLLTWLLPDPKGQDIFVKIARIWMRFWLTIIGCRIIMKGKENFIKGEVYIITCNHNSLLDPPLSSPFIQGPNKTIAKSDFDKVPIFKWYYRKGGILVDRKSEESRRKSYEKMKEVLRVGIHMCIYPEGTRNRTNEPLKPFYSGAFRLATETGHSVMPAVILNTKQVLPPERFLYGWPGKVEIHFLPPITPAGKSVEEIKAEVYEVMRAYYLKHSTQ
jgi:1-acyl-sn-glycerol-3-phosphate acyltransferase